MIELKLTPEFAARRAGHRNELHALVRAVAPAPPAGSEIAERAPLNLALVIDRSGSMQGRPLAEAKRAAARLARRLRPVDRVAVVAFGNEADVIFPGGPAGDGRAVAAAIRRIECEGMTALHSGWLTGAEQLARMRGRCEIARVLLLSDGQANVGPSEPDVLARDAARLAAAGVTTTTCGLGLHFDETLMTAMARAGQGSAYYGQTAEDLDDPFQEEFELLANLCARSLRLRLRPGEGVEATVLNGHSERDGAWELPDLAWGGEAWALVRLEFDERDARDEMADLRLLLSAGLQFERLDGEDRTAGPAALRLPRVAAAAFDALVADPTVRARRRELAAAEMLRSARDAADRGRWLEVDRLIVSARSDAEEDAWLGACLAEIKQLADTRNARMFSKEALYSSHRMAARLSTSCEAPSASYLPDAESGKALYLRRKAMQGRSLDRPHK